MTAVPENMALIERHYDLLHVGSGISDAVIRERGYRSAMGKSDFEGTEFTTGQRRPPGILIPVWSVNGKQVGSEFRPDEPRRNRDALIKYEWPTKKGRRFDIPPRCLALLPDPEVPLWITEGAKKADALASHGQCVLNIGGVWNWRTRNDFGGIALNADLDSIPLNNRVIYLCFDSDVSVKVPVKRALQRLTAILTRRGARVRIILIPGTAEYKQGIDDFLVAHQGDGGKALQRLVDDAIDADADEPMTPVLLAVKGAPVSLDANVPRGYRMDLRGVRTLVMDRDYNEVEQTILPSPLVVTHRHRDVDSGDEQTTLGLFRDGTWRHLTVGREVVSDARSIVKLAAAGLPVTSNTAKLLIDYIAAYESQNLEVIPIDLTTHTCGWKKVDQQDVFMLGTTLYGAESGTVDFIADDTGNKRFVEALKPAGAFSEWQQAIVPLLKFPRVALGLYAAMTTPVLDLVNAPGFAIDVAGNSSIGKTAWLEIASSIWGMPTKERGGLVKGWDGTKVFMERYAALMSGLPLFFDESQLADPRYLARIVYALTNGEGRGRGSIAGLRDSGSWRTIVFSTGEHPLYETSQDQGLRARTLLLWGSPFGGTDQGETVRTAMTAIRTNYGHAGPRGIQWLLDHRDEWPEMRIAHERVYAELVKEASGSNLADRYAAYFAAMHVGGLVAHEAWGLPGTADQAVKLAFKETLIEVEESNYGGRALEAVLGWVVANRGQFYGSHDTEREPKELYGAWSGPDDDLSIFEPQLKAFLKSQGFGYDATMRTWKEKGWLKINGGGRGMKAVRKIRGFSHRMPTIRRECLQEDSEEV